MDPPSDKKECTSVSRRIGEDGTWLGILFRYLSLSWAPIRPCSTANSAIVLLRSSSSFFSVLITLAS